MKETTPQAKVSVIIPVFNTEKYILKCAESLFRQTYPEIEYIFINDCSTDNSLKLLTQLSCKYDARDIKIINNSQNVGSSATRNIGVETASGEYITFCDSDDWIEPYAIEQMISFAHHTKADVVVCPFFNNTYNIEKILYYKSPDIAELNTIPINYQHFSLVNKLFKATLIKDNLSLPGIDCWEDLSIVSRIYATSPKVVLLNTPFYHYRKYEHKSLTSDSHERQLKDRLQYTEFLLKWFTAQGLNIKYERFLNHLKFTSKIKMLRTSPRQYRRWKHTFPESNRHIMSYTDIPLHYRILFYLAAHLIP